MLWSMSNSIAEWPSIVSAVRIQYFSRYLELVRNPPSRTLELKFATAFAHADPLGHGRCTHGHHPSRSVGRCLHLLHDSLRLVSLAPNEAQDEDGYYEDGARRNDDGNMPPT